MGASFIKLSVVASLLLLLSPAAHAAEPHAYDVPDSEVLSIHSEKTGADYAVYVSHPDAAPEKGKSFPVVYMLDADYSFAIVQSIVRHFIERNNLPPMVLVGIATPGGIKDRNLYKLARTRDFTPTFVASGGYGPEFQKGSGGAPKFADFIASELAPLIEDRYYGASDDRTIVGHSYGGLFAAYALVTRPEIFQRFIIVSPSLWYDDRLIFRLKARDAQAKAPARVFLSVGAIEQQQMSDDITALKAALDERKDASLTVDIKIFEDETHNSVFPAAVTRGLLKVFDAFPALAPPPSPQTPN